MGNALRKQGQLEQAVECYRQALRCNPTAANAHYNLGNALKDLGQSAQAVECFRNALRINPQNADACINLGNLLKGQGQPAQAIECFRQALRINPQYAEAHNNLGVTLKDQAEPAQAIECFRQALRINPRYAEAHHNLGFALKDSQLAEAIKYFRQALDLNPLYVDAHNNLGVTFKEQGRLAEAIDCFRLALRINARHTDAYVNLGNVLKDQGLLRKALACYRRAVKLNPGDVEADSNVLNLLHFCPDFDSAAIYEEHRRWYRQHAQPLEKLIRPHVNDPAPERRLRIGYISPDFRNHVLAMSFVPLFSGHEHENHELFFYADVLLPDGITHRIRSYADVWRNINGLTDEQVADMVRQDRIDILVDLTMHMGRNRLLVFARKPAPVQVTWGAYPGTTGLTTIDYRLTDPYLDPSDIANLPYSEQSVRLPNSFWCYDPLTSEPAVNSLPALKNGFVTFGCLNNFCKVNDFTLRLWAKVLRAIPSSRLVLLAPEGKIRSRTLGVLEHEGIAAERVTLVGRKPRAQYLELYHQIDLGLDSLPYNGHTTSLDSYWMGVPVVTMVGKTIVGRAGLCQLSNLGLRELIASSPEELVNIVVSLAADPERMSMLRATLRERMQQSPLMDARGFAGNIEAAYRDMWKRWCATAQ